MILQTWGCTVTRVLLLATFWVLPAAAAGADPAEVSEVAYSRAPSALLVSFKEVYPEFADQDPTPLLRIYGDGTVVVYRPSYMKQAGRFEMLLGAAELDALMLELASALLPFDPAATRDEIRALEDLVWNAADDPEDLVIFQVADAEVSQFELNIQSFSRSGIQGLVAVQQPVKRQWRGLRYDVQNYPELEGLKLLLRAENMLRGLASNPNLVQVPVP
jgi:hypothetical protein